jgi:L-methionine (R)-S-oxide reductase
MAVPVEKPLDKAATYAKVEAELSAFFVKYPGVDTVGRMATIKWVARARARAHARTADASDGFNRAAPACLCACSSFLNWHFKWGFVGFYTVKEAGKTLQIGPYQGRVLATALIAFGRGVCGTAAAEGTTQIVEDTATCMNYIPCDDVTRSEIVVPVFGRNGHNEPEAAVGAPRKLIAVLDIDSDELAGFDAVDKECLERLMATYF